MDLPKIVKEQRKRLGLTQQDLAEMASVSLPTVKDIERGAANPSLSTIEKILDVLGLQLDCNYRRTF